MAKFIKDNLKVKYNYNHKLKVYKDPVNLTMDQTFYTNVNK